eukprot:3364598-Amphidinium_carterae.1
MKSSLCKTKVVMTTASFDSRLGLEVFPMSYIMPSSLTRRLGPGTKAYRMPCHAVSQCSRAGLDIDA